MPSRPVLLPDDWTTEQAERAARSVLLRRLGHAEGVAQAVIYWRAPIM
jgi:hypothetical protein